jgi:hypothetical protein
MRTISTRCGTVGRMSVLGTELRGLWSRLTGRPFKSVTRGDAPRVAIGDLLRIRISGGPDTFYRVIDCDADRTVILTVTPIK